jgi:hypothetical protein
VALNITNSLDNWNFQDANVERIMDNAAYTSAHPDDTLIVVGPPRRTDFDGTPLNSLTAVGMMQAFQYSAQKNVVPMRTIGSGRSFFLSDKASYQFQMGRLFVKGKNLLRALYQNAISRGIDLGDMDEHVSAAAQGSNSNVSGYFINFDSELFLVPFGMGVIFRDKAHNSLGAFYMELCMLNSYTVGVNAGQNMVMDNVSGLCDRVVALPDADQLASRMANWNTSINITGSDVANGLEDGDVIP